MLRVPWLPSKGQGEQMKVSVKAVCRAFLQEDAGQDLIEYALLTATLALGTLLAIQGVRDALGNEFNTISTTLGS